MLTLESPMTSHGSLTCRCQYFSFLRVFGCLMGVRTYYPGEAGEEGEGDEQDDSSAAVIRSCGLGTVPVLTLLVFLGVDSPCMRSSTKVFISSTDCGGWMEREGGFSWIGVSWSAVRILSTQWSFGAAGLGPAACEVSGGEVGLDSLSCSCSLSEKGDQSLVMWSVIVIVAVVLLNIVHVAGGSWTCAKMVIIRPAPVCCGAGCVCRTVGCVTSVRSSIVSSCIISPLPCGCLSGSLAVFSSTVPVAALRSASFATISARACSRELGWRRRPRFLLAQGVAISNGPPQSCLGNSEELLFPSLCSQYSDPEGSKWLCEPSF